MASTLVIADGSLAGLVAAAIERDRGVDVIAWVPPAGTGLSAPGFAPSDAPHLIRQQAAVLGFERIIDHHHPGHGPEAADAPQGLRTTALLLAAAREAIAAGCDRIVWPIAVEDDLSAMARADERADLVTRLLVIDEEAGQARAPEIVLPVVDLTESQIAALGEDLGVPRHLCAASPASATAGA